MLGTSGASLLRGDCQRHLLGQSIRSARLLEMNSFGKHHANEVFEYPFIFLIKGEFMEN